MTACRFLRLHYESFAWTNAIWRVCALLVMVLAAVPLIWLDEANVQGVGFVLYPLESALNTLLFPGVTTPLRGNGTALLILAPTVALLAVAFSAVLAFGAFVHGAFDRTIGRAR